MIKLASNLNMEFIYHFCLSKDTVLGNTYSYMSMRRFEFFALISNECLTDQLVFQL